MFATRRGKSQDRGARCIHAGCCSGKSCSLSSLRMGDTRCVTCVHSNRRLLRHLASLGILPGTEIDVVSVNANTLIIKVRGGRLTLSRDIAEMIMVA